MGCDELCEDAAGTEFTGAAAGVGVAACGKFELPDFSSELAGVPARETDGLAAEDGAAEALGEPAADAGVVVAALEGAAVGKRMPQKPATGSVNSSSI